MAPAKWRVTKYLPSSTSQCGSRPRQKPMVAGLRTNERKSLNRTRRFKTEVRFGETDLPKTHSADQIGQDTFQVVAGVDLSNSLRKVFIRIERLSRAPRRWQRWPDPRF